MDNSFQSYMYLSGLNVLINSFRYALFLFLRESQKFKDIQMISKKNLTRVCKKIFLIKAKKKFVLGVPKFMTKTFIFEYFPKIPSEMNSKHPFYSILIPMTSHAKIFILVVGGPKGVPEP